MGFRDLQTTLMLKGLIVLTSDEATYRQTLEKAFELGCRFNAPGDGATDQHYDSATAGLFISASGGMYIILPEDLRKNPENAGMVISLDGFMALDLSAFAEQVCDRQANKARVMQAKHLKEQLHNALYENNVQVSSAVIDALNLAMSALKKAQV